MTSVAQRARMALTRRRQAGRALSVRLPCPQLGPQAGCGQLARVASRWRDGFAIPAGRFMNSQVDATYDAPTGRVQSCGRVQTLLRVSSCVKSPDTSPEFGDARQLRPHSRAGPLSYPRWRFRCQRPGKKIRRESTSGDAHSCQHAGIHPDPLAGTVGRAAGALRQATSKFACD